MSVDTAKRGLASTAYLVLIQVVSRGLTFVGNQALLRYVSPGHLGLAAQLEVLSVSVLYNARESLRVALQRLPHSRPESRSSGRNVQLQSAVNASYLVVLLGVLLSLILGPSYFYRAGPELLHTAHFESAFWLYMTATVIELFSEPGFVVIQQNALFNIRARAETTAAITRCLAACSTAVVLGRVGSPVSVLPFAVGQVCYALTLLLVYCWSASSVAASDGFTILPSKLVGLPDTIMSVFFKPLLALAGAFYGQSIFKWLLTQGDSLVLSLFADLKAQGIFALASNYGGLASRLLFQPVEESSRNVFGGLLANDSSKAPKITGKKTSSSMVTNKRQQALNYLSTALHSYILLIVMPCFAILPYCFPPLVAILLGPSSQWNSPQTVALLQIYSYYIPMLAINGILDAFVTSVATEIELGWQSAMMLGVTMIYLSAAYFNMTVMQLGAVGLVYANILNMSLRIGYSIWFIDAWTKQNIPQNLGDKRSTFGVFIKRALPTNACLFSFISTLLALYVKTFVKDNLKRNGTVMELSNIKLGLAGLDLFDLSYVFSAAVILLSSVVLTERDFLVETLEPLLPQQAREALRPFLKDRNQKHGQKSK